MTAPGLTWRKSTYSNDTGGNCVEVAEMWRKSSHSGATNDCVEVRPEAPAVGVRDTQHRSHGHLTFPTCEWAAFLQQAKDGHV